MDWSDPEISRLQQQTEQSRLQFIRTDLDLLRTLAGVVQTELALNNNDHAAQTLARAQKGYVDVSRIFEQRNSWDEKASNEIREKLAWLRQELDRLQQLVHAAA